MDYGLLFFFTPYVVADVDRRTVSVIYKISQIYHNFNFIGPGLTQLAQTGRGGSRATRQFKLNQVHRNTWAFELLLTEGIPPCH